MVSIKFAAVVLALVCIFHLQESSAFLVKRDTTSPSTGGGEDPFKKAINDLQSYFKDFQHKIEKIVKETNATAKLNEFGESVKEWTQNAEQTIKTAAADLQKSIGSS